MTFNPAGKKLDKRPTKRSKRTDSNGIPIEKQRSQAQRATKRLKKAAKGVPLKKFARETNMPEGKAWIQRKKDHNR